MSKEILVRFDYEIMRKISLVTPYSVLNSMSKEDRLSHVIQYDKQLGDRYSIKVTREYKNYLNTPEIDLKVNKSYMFKGDLKSEVKKSALPSELEGVFQYIKKEYDSRYNQLTVNWYDIGQGIVKHSDCTSKMVEDSKILILSFLEHSSDKHFFTLYDKLDNKIEVVNFSRNNVIEMSGASQLTTRHKVDSSSTNKGGRVSLTFRMMRED